MKKDGFIFVETVTVLIVLALSLAMSLSSYNLLASKSKQKQYYDIASDKYLVWSINELGNKTGINYQAPFVATKDTCTSTTMGNVLSDCKSVFKDTNMVYFIIVNNIQKSLESSTATKTYDNGTIEYMKTLKRFEDDNTTPISYAIGVFYRKGKYYYASIIL